jgi:hypothetical protein
VEEAQGVMKLVEQLKDERDMLTSKVESGENCIFIHRKLLHDFNAF